MAFEWFDDLKAQKAALDKQIADQGKGKLEEAFKAFFVANPQIKVIRWTAYTPYFNDGEACVFNVYEPTFMLISQEENEDEEYDGSDFDFPKDDWNFQYDTKDPTTTHAQEILKAVAENSNLRENVLNFKKLWDNEDVFELVFGDHVEVIATPDGFDVNEYSHD